MTAYSNHSAIQQTYTLTYYSLKWRWATQGWRITQSQSKKWAKTGQYEYFISKYFKTSDNSNWSSKPISNTSQHTSFKVDRLFKKVRNRIHPVWSISRRFFQWQNVPCFRWQGEQALISYQVKRSRVKEEDRRCERGRYNANFERPW